MRQPIPRQQVLPFADEVPLWETLPQEHRDHSRMLLARLLAEVIAGESAIRRSNERREDPIDPP
jgi:hypothetical protein